MKAVKSAFAAWNKKDWDELARITIPFLPPLPSDGKPKSNTHERETFGKIIPALQLPKPLEAAAQKYLSGASDFQVNIIANHVRELAAVLNDPAKDRRSPGVRGPMQLVT